MEYIIVGMFICLIALILILYFMFLDLEKYVSLKIYDIERFLYYFARDFGEDVDIIDKKFSGKK